MLLGGINERERAKREVSRSEKKIYEYRRDRERERERETEGCKCEKQRITSAHGTAWQKDDEKSEYVVVKILVEVGVGWL